MTTLVGWRSSISGDPIIEGYNFLMAEGFEDAARICLTHTFPVKDVNFTFGNWDCTDDERQFIARYLARTEYADYDRLFQLCDHLATEDGFCLMEKRMVDVAVRHGTNDKVARKWEEVFKIQKEFEEVIGRLIYTLLPEVVENTFGC